MNEGCELKAGVIYEMDQIYQAGKDVLCSDKCACNVDSGIFSTEVAAKMVTDPNGQTRLDQCPYDTATAVATTSQKTKFYQVMEILETDF